MRDELDLDDVAVAAVKQRLRQEKRPPDRCTGASPSGAAGRPRPRAGGRKPTTLPTLWSARVRGDREAGGGRSIELRHLLAAIDHPAAGQALEMVRRGHLRTAEACLEAALVRLAGDPDGSDLEWSAAIPWPTGWPEQPAVERQAAAITQAVA